MKKATIILLLIYLSLATVGQRLDRTFYLLGTLEDYMGRHYPKNNPGKWSYIMTLHQDRIGEIKRIEEVTGAKFKQRRKQKNCSNCQEFYELKSFFRAKKINSFYEFNKNKGMRDKLGFTFYTGQLNCERILNATKDQQISFLAGQFLTDGEKKAQAYKLALYNSPNRFECLLKVLQNLKCEVIRKEEVEGIPVGYFIEFKPTDMIKKIIDIEILKKHTLVNSG
ncbi:MAG: hypothetical protein ACQESX_05490 [Bacteroidota bacterium]